MLLALLIASAAGAAHSTIHRFEDVQVGTAVLRIPIPPSYCKPQGKKAVAMQTIAQGDNRNVTVLALVECTPTSQHRYLLAKVPVRALDMPVERSEVIKGLVDALQTSESAPNWEQLKQKVAENKSEALGVHTDIKGEFGPRGHDDVCVYLGGSMTTSAADASETQAAGTCMSAAGGRFIALNAYEDTSDPDAYKALLPKLKEWLLQIKAVRAPK